MKKSLFTLTCLFAMMATSLSAKAQEITINLFPGWTWISYPKTEAMDIATALGDFVPVEGDIINSQYSSATYRNGQWRGRLQQFTPGLGYMYYSMRGEPTTLVFGGSTPQNQVLVTTSEPLLITAISAMCGGEVTTNDGTYIIVKGLCWATHENPTTNDDFYQEAESGVGSFSVSMTGLNISTTYYVRAYAVTPNGTVYGDEKTFTTRDGIPTVTTAEVTNIQGETAICGGNVTDNCGLTVTVRGVCWSTSPNPTLEDSHTTNGSEMGSFSSSITGLTISTIYYVRAYATTSAGTGYGEQVNFTTRNGIPTVTTAEVTNIQGETATCGGTVTDNGGLTVTARGVCWSTSHNPTVSDSHTTNGSGLGSFSSSITGLSVSTTYYVRAYASTSQGIAYGEEISFTTCDGILEVSTVEVTNILGDGATCGGTVTGNSGLNVTVRGVCWSTVHNPTISDSHTTNGSGLGSFTSTMTGMDVSTTYYVRAYATTSAGTAYGEEVSFTTRDGIPEVSTAEVTNIMVYSAICGGMVTDNGGLSVTARGVCWSMSPNPMVSGNCTNDDSGLGGFTSSITGLSAGTTYYVRAYATTSYATSYGEEMTFTTHESGDGNNPAGSIGGLFSVSAMKLVYFSQGNLQYIGSASTPYWKFADNQWDVLGTTTGQNSSNQNVDRDLFGWGTSGWNNGNTYYHPWDTDNSSLSSYGPPGSYDLTGSYANADWGVYNPISNGGNQPNQWRTLTQREWAYIFNSRTTSSGIRYAKANVNNVNGVILLPDDWSTSYYTLSNTNSSSASFSSNTITASQWSTLEQHGAVFLPAAGYRGGTSVINVGSYGLYWSASYLYSTQAYGIGFGDSSLNTEGQYNRAGGRSVRLVAPAN